MAIGCPAVSPTRCASRTRAWTISTGLAACAVEQYLARQPSPDDDDDFDDRFVQVGTTFGSASCVRGNLTPECAAAVQAVLDAMGKKRGPEDHRTEGQRFHDALQEACALLMASCRSVQLPSGQPNSSWRTAADLGGTTSSGKNSAHI